jgi:hypothetical protein
MRDGVSAKNLGYHFAHPGYEFSHCGEHRAMFSRNGAAPKQGL